MSELRALALEGVPGTGKSSVAGALAAIYDAQHTSLPESFRRFRRDSDLDRSPSSLTRLVYYLGATSHMVDLIDAQRPVIFDRWLPSVLGLAEASGDLERDEIAAIAEPIVRRLPAPAMTVVLVATPDVLRDRTTDRRKPSLHLTTVHDRALTDPGFLTSWEQAIVDWSARLGPHRVIDTSSMTPADVTTAVREFWPPGSDSRR